MEENKEKKMKDVLREEMDKELQEISVKEHNVRGLLNLVLSILTEEQLELLKVKLGELEAEIEEKEE